MERSLIRKVHTKMIDRGINIRTIVSFFKGCIFIINSNYSESCLVIQSLRLLDLWSVARDMNANGPVV